ncbi:hypothetical protein M3Y94_01261600 [Aphelenchoides besseyi]|nr:hypothetical protein M3Y94_01261600 [Aphelenchoides besseyi]KAI6222548.1 hypothetical protein M3Y95_00905100 [Aphelenchoides besseyi]
MSEPQLTIYSKAILLMHRIKNTSNPSRYYNTSAFEFFRFLLISRQFLRASQLYRVYQFMIRGYCDYQKIFEVSITTGDFSGSWVTCFCLKLKEIRSLNQLLDVQYLYLDGYQYEDTIEFMAVSRMFTGHIALKHYSGTYAEENHVAIIEQVQKQLYFLRGDALSLIASSNGLCLNLAASHMDIENLYELKKVLAKHRPKKIVAECRCYRTLGFDPAIDDNFFEDFPTCSSVEKLEVNWDDRHEDNDFVSKITKMMPFFPNLVKLFCRSYIFVNHRLEEFNVQKLVVWIQNECRKIEELQKACLPTTQIVLNYACDIPKEVTVVEKLRKILQTTNFNYTSSVEQYNYVHITGEHTHCIVSLKFLLNFTREKLDFNYETGDKYLRQKELP